MEALILLLFMHLLLKPPILFPYLFSFPLAPFCANVILQANRSLIAISLPAHLDGEKLRQELEDYLRQEATEKEQVSKSIVTDHQDLIALKKLWIEILECPAELIGTEEKFHQLGGDSLKLLSMLSELADDFQLEPQSSFLSKALNTGGDLNIRQLLQIMEPYRTSKQSA